MLRQIIWNVEHVAIAVCCSVDQIELKLHVHHRGMTEPECGHKSVSRDVDGQTAVLCVYIYAVVQHMRECLSFAQCNHAS